MCKKIKNFEMEKFQSSKADLEKSMSLETVRLYDYINNRIRDFMMYTNNQGPFVKKIRIVKIFFDFLVNSDLKQLTIKKGGKVRIKIRK